MALTRARDGLILCGLMPGGEKRAEKDRSLLSIERAGGEFVPAPGEVSRREADAWLRRNTAGAREKAAPGADVPLTVLRPRALRSVSATSHALWSLCPAAWRLSFRQNLDLSWSAGEGETLHEAPGGAELGNVAHWILSKWDFSDGDYRRILGLRDGHLRPEFRRVWRDPASRRELERFLRNFHSPDGEKLLARLRRALAEGTLAREYPFKVRLGPVDLVGVVDVFWIESDAGRPSRLCVRDYKTARLPKDPLRRRAGSTAPDRASAARNRSSKCRTRVPKKIWKPRSCRRRRRRPKARGRPTARAAPAAPARAPACSAGAEILWRREMTCHSFIH